MNVPRHLAVCLAAAALATVLAGCSASGGLGLAGGGGALCAPATEEDLTVGGFALAPQSDVHVSGAGFSTSQGLELVEVVIREVQPGETLVGAVPVDDETTAVLARGAVVGAEGVDLAAGNEYELVFVVRLEEDAATGRARGPYVDVSSPWPGFRETSGFRVAVKADGC